MALAWSAWGMRLHPAAVAVLVSGLFNPIGLVPKAAAMSLMGRGPVLAGRLERRVLIALTLMGCLGWSWFAAHDRLLRYSDLWHPWKVASALNVRLMVMRSPAPSTVGPTGPMGTTTQE